MDLTIQELDNRLHIDIDEWSHIRHDYIPGYVQTALIEQPSLSDSSDSSVDLETINLNDTKQIESPKINPIKHLLPVAVAESVTAGALSNTLCSEPGSSKFFLGGIIAYNMATQTKLLNVDAEYAEKNNFANPFTTLTMAKNVTDLFKARIGISTTGFSLPTYRTADPIKGKCEIDVKIPYAYICIYDSLTDFHKIYKVTNDDYSANGNQKIQRAEMQVKVATYCKKIFDEYCNDKL